VRNFVMIFGAEEKVRLAPTFDEKPKSTEITPFWACSGYNVLAKKGSLMTTAFYKLLNPQ